MHLQNLQKDKGPAMLPSRFLQFHYSSNTLTMLGLLQCINFSAFTLPSSCLFPKLELNCHEASPVLRSHE